MNELMLTANLGEEEGKIISHSSIIKVGMIFVFLCKTQCITS